MSAVTSTHNAYRKQTFYKAGLQWGPPSSFNPFAANIAWPVGNELLIYETLFAYNLLTGELDPILAKSIDWIDDSNATSRSKTERDGKTARLSRRWTVAYTISLGDKYSLNYTPIWDHSRGACPRRPQGTDLSMKTPTRGWC